MIHSCSVYFQCIWNWSGPLELWKATQFGNIFTIIYGIYTSIYRYPYVKLIIFLDVIISIKLFHLIKSDLLESNLRMIIKLYIKVCDNYGIGNFLFEIGKNILFYIGMGSYNGLKLARISFYSIHDLNNSDRDLSAENKICIFIPLFQHTRAHRQIQRQILIPPFPQVIKFFSQKPKSLLVKIHLPSKDKA